MIAKRWVLVLFFGARSSAYRLLPQPLLRRRPGAGQTVTSRAKTRANNADQGSRWGRDGAQVQVRPWAWAGIGRQDAMLTQQIESGRWDEDG